MVRGGMIKREGDDYKKGYDSKGEWRCHWMKKSRRGVAFLHLSIYLFPSYPPSNPPQHSTSTAQHQHSTTQHSTALHITAHQQRTAPTHHQHNTVHTTNSTPPAAYLRMMVTGNSSLVDPHMAVRQAPATMSDSWSTPPSGRRRLTGGGGWGGVV